MPLTGNGIWPAIPPRGPIAVHGADAAGREVFSVATVAGQVTGHGIRTGLWIIPTHKGNAFSSPAGAAASGVDTRSLLRTYGTRSDPIARPGSLHRRSFPCNGAAYRRTDRQEPERAALARSIRAGLHRMLSAVGNVARSARLRQQPEVIGQAATSSVENVSRLMQRECGQVPPASERSVGTERQDRLCSEQQRPQLTDDRFQLLMRHWRRSSVSRSGFSSRSA